MLAQFETEGGVWWFGGGSDITPAYLFEEDIKHFHGTYKVRVASPRSWRRVTPHGVAYAEISACVVGSRRSSARESREFPVGA